MNSSTSPGQSLVREIVESVAENVEGDALTLAPLGTVVDPELLNTFVGTTAVGAETTLQFEYEQCEVTVHGDGRVAISGPPPRPKEGVG